MLIPNDRLLADNLKGRKSVIDVVIEPDEVDSMWPSGIMVPCMRFTFWIKDENDKLYGLKTPKEKNGWKYYTCVSRDEEDYKDLDGLTPLQILKKIKGGRIDREDYLEDYLKAHEAEGIQWAIDKIDQSMKMLHERLSAHQERLAVLRKVEKA